MAVFKIILIVVATLAAAELIVWLIFRFVIYRYSSVNRLPEFPHVSDRLLEKFVTWNPVLGWAYLPNFTSIKRDDHDKSNILFSHTSDTFGSRTIFEHDHPIGKIACYGDSYCHCLKVNDSDTWPWFLGKISGYRVANYGVGNHGFDQAIIRMFDKDAVDPAEIIIMALATDTSERIRAVYQHYGQSGNILAVKPRFRINKKGELEFVPLPIKSKEDYKRLSDFKDYFHKYDDNYPIWKDIKARFPYLLSFFRGGWIYAPFIKLLSGRFPIQYQPRYKLTNRDNLVIKAWEDEVELFVKLTELYTGYCKVHNKKPVLLFQNQRQWVEWSRKNGRRPYDKAKKQIQKRIPELIVVDSMDWLIDMDESQLNIFYGESHPSPMGNKMIAEKLLQELQNQDLLKVSPTTSNNKCQKA